MRNFYILLTNLTDVRDNEVQKVRASTKEKAKEQADFNSSRFELDRVLTQAELKAQEPEWHALLWGTKPKQPRPVVKTDFSSCALARKRIMARR